MKRKVYEKYTVYNEGQPDYVVYINVDDMRWAVPVLDGYVRDATQKSKQKIKKQEEIIRVLNEDNTRLLEENMILRTPWYKKIFKRKT